MKLTVPFPVSDRPVEESGVLSFINNELIKLLRQVRAALNFTGSDRASAGSAGAGAFVTVWTSVAMPNDAVWNVVANVTGISTGGIAQQAGYILAGTFASVAGVVSQIGTSTVIHSAESAAAIDARFGTGSRSVFVEARDNAVSPMRWIVVTEVLEALPT